MIYEPKGRAREYSPLALNIYNGCDHDCEYCYMKSLSQQAHMDKSELKANWQAQLEKSVKKFKNAGKQVLLSFSSDPYPPVEMESGATRTALQMLLENRIPVAVLTKSGKLAERDIDIFKRFGKSFKFGATLTFCEEQDVKKYERGAASYADRIDMLQTLNKQGVETWASLEPVIDVKQTLQIIKDTHGFIDHYKVGKINHFKFGQGINWSYFLASAVELLESLDKMYYIKEDLAKFYNSEVELLIGKLRPQSLDMDFLNVKPFSNSML